MEGVTDEEKAVWIPNLRSVISKASKVTFANLEAIAGGEKPTEDGSGPIASLDLSQVVLTWGSLWDKAEEATSMDRVVAERFMHRQEESGLITCVDLKAPMAWRLACMEAVGEEVTAKVFKEISASKTENMEKNELFLRYLRASAFSCQGFYTPALKEEIEEKEAMGDYGNLTLSCIGIMRHLPKSKASGDTVTPSDKRLGVYNTDLTWRMDKIHERDERKEELKAFVTKHFTVDGRKPAIISAG
eukprot:3024303-Rhodomonas_salina.1